MLAVFGYTPTGNPSDPPSTSFSRAEPLRPSGVRLRSARYARLRSASPPRGEAEWKNSKLQKEVYTGHNPPRPESEVETILPRVFTQDPVFNPLLLRFG
jgi:hypothetical protein